MGGSGFLRAKIGEQAELAAKVAISPLLQAIIAEKTTEEAKRLIDLASQKPVEGPLIRYIGPARFIVTESPVTPDAATLPQQAFDVISRKRQTQQTILKGKNKDTGKVVLTFMKENAVYASIASTEFLETSFSRCFSHPPSGILCRMEGPAQNGVTFLDPFWIWHEKPS